MMVEITDNGELFMAIYCWIVAICDLVLGYSEVSRELPSMPWKSDSSSENQSTGASAAGAAPSSGAGNPSVAYDSRADRYKVELTGE
jgi:hypothetical protein